MKAAESLIKELSMKEYDTTILECYGMIHTQKKEYLAKAMKMLQDMLNSNAEYVPAIVCLAFWKFISKKNSEAKSLLDKMNNQNYLPEYAEDCEAWRLLLADYNINNSNYAEAEQLLYKCLQLSKILVKAEEFMGIISENEGNFANAADHYQAAWKISLMRNTSVGLIVFKDI